MLEVQTSLPYNLGALVFKVYKLSKKQNHFNMFMCSYMVTAYKNPVGLNITYV